MAFSFPRNWDMEITPWRTACTACEPQCSSRFLPAPSRPRSPMPQAGCEPRSGRPRRTPRWRVPGANRRLRRGIAHPIWTTATGSIMFPVPWTTPRGACGSRHPRRRGRSRRGKRSAGAYGPAATVFAPARRPYGPHASSAAIDNPRDDEGAVEQSSGSAPARAIPAAQTMRWPTVSDWQRLVIIRPVTHASNPGAAVHCLGTMVACVNNRQARDSIILGSMARRRSARK